MKASALILVILLSGCGQKGPLYFAPENSSDAATESGDAAAPQTATDTRTEDED